VTRGPKPVRLDGWWRSLLRATCWPSPPLPGCTEVRPSRCGLPTRRSRDLAARPAGPGCRSLRCRTGRSTLLMATLLRSSWRGNRAETRSRAPGLGSLASSTVSSTLPRPRSRPKPVPQTVRGLALRGDAQLAPGRRPPPKRLPLSGLALLAGGALRRSSNRRLSPPRPPFPGRRSGTRPVRRSGSLRPFPGATGLFARAAPQRRSAGSGPRRASLPTAPTSTSSGWPAVRAEARPLD
jgi:hypothetical protein